MKTIRCRVRPIYWWTVAGCFLMGAFLLFAPFQIAQEEPKSSPWPLFFIFGPVMAFLWGGAVCLSLSLLREEVIADENGLRWRGAFGPWKSARWDEISDFYLGKLKRTPTIETSQGKLKLIPEFAATEEMMVFIAQCATNAPAREWEMEKLRAHRSFSKRFDYWTKTQKWTVPVVFGTMGFCGISLFVLSYFSPNSETQTRPKEISWHLDWLSLLMALFSFGPTVALFVIFAPMTWRERNFAFEHRDEHLEISPRGLAWQNGETRIEANWDEVRAIHSVPRRGFGARNDYRVETRNGDFTIWNSLENIQLWLELARQFAPQIAPAPPITNRDLGDETATWSGRKIGQGARVFHFRTSDARLILWAASIFSVAFAAHATADERHENSR